MSADNFTRPDLPPALRLSPIKKAVARALKTNKSIGQIASELGKSKNYIAKIAGNLYVRFGAQDRAHFAAMLVLPLNSSLLVEGPPIGGPSTGGFNLRASKCQLAHRCKPVEGASIEAPKTRAEKIASLMRAGHTYLSAVDVLDVSA
jgi:DNA-binding CsgD family transcriptional regulator